jgi:hypothetical protein
MQSRTARREADDIAGEAVRSVEIPPRIQPIESLERFESRLDMWPTASPPD